MVAPNPEQLQKSRLKKLKNFKSSHNAQDSDLELQTIKNTSENLETQVSDFQNDLNKLRQLHCDSTIKLFKSNNRTKPVTKDTDELIEMFVTKSV